MRVKQIGGSKKVWDNEKHKYVDKQKSKETKAFVHKNRYVIFKGLLMKGKNVPYMTDETLQKRHETKHREAYLEFGEGLKRMNEAYEKLVA